MKRLVLLLVVVWGAAGPLVHAYEGHAEVARRGQAAFIDPGLLGFRGLREIVNVHPAVVHFPVALFPSALLLYGLGMLLKRRAWIVAGRACLSLAAAGTAVAIVTGWQAQGTFPHNARIHHMMMTHLNIGLLIGALSLVLVLWSFLHRDQRPKAAYPFLALLALATYLVLQNGDLGSRMVYVEGAAVNPAAPEEAAPHHHAH
jgi:uncharacterized membrane protein